MLNSTTNAGFHADIFVLAKRAGALSRQGDMKETTSVVAE
jgi:hypothetical protein